MPIYEYICTACEHELEAIQKMAEQPLEFCPECGEPALKKKISAAAFQLKGSGWYETDFKNSGGKKTGTKAGEGASAKNNDKAASGDRSSKAAASKSGHSCGAGCSH